MKVLVAGYPKTGTKSMHSALRELGYSVYDYDTNFYHLCDDWMKIIAQGGSREDFQRMYKDIDASMDMPACVFWEEILDAFPDCKIILTQRKDEDAWYDSWKRQADINDGSIPMKTLGLFSPSARKIFKYSDYMSRITFCSPTQGFLRAFTGISPIVAKKRYRDHNAAVKARAPKDQLLEFQMKDGWEPLCKFLGAPIPNKPFPHKNQRGSVLDDYLANSPVFKAMRKEMNATLATIIVIFGIALFFFLQ